MRSARAWVCVPWSHGGFCDVLGDRLTGLRQAGRAPRPKATKKAARAADDGQVVVDGTSFTHPGCVLAHVAPACSSGESAGVTCVRFGGCVRVGQSGRSPNAFGSRSCWWMRQI